MITSFENHNQEIKYEARLTRGGKLIKTWQEGFCGNYLLSAFNEI